MTAALVSVIYQDVFEDNIEQNVAGLLYFLTTELLFTHVYAVINTFPGEFHIFLREKDLYSTQSYFISKLAAMVIREAAVLHSLIFYIKLTSQNWYNDLKLCQHILYILGPKNIFPTIVLLRKHRSSRPIHTNSTSLHCHAFYIIHSFLRFVSTRYYFALIQTLRALLSILF